MLAQIFVILLIYTFLEITYWYFKWWRQLKREPMPVVKSLLFAVFYAHLMRVITLFYYKAIGQDASFNAFFSMLVLFGAIAYLIPIWKQKLHRLASPLFYGIRAVVFTFITVIIFG